MQCKRVGNRIEITPDCNLLTYRNRIRFVKSLDGVRWHGFDKPPRKVWTVLDTPETRGKLAAKGYPVSEGCRGLADMFTGLENLSKTLDSI